MRVCARCMCADAEDSMAVAYEVLGWSSPERVQPDSLDVERLRRLGCSCSEFPGSGLARTPRAAGQDKARTARAASTH